MTDDPLDPLARRPAPAGHPAPVPARPRTPAPSIDMADDALDDDPLSGATSADDSLSHAASAGDPLSNAASADMLPPAPGEMELTDEDRDLLVAIAAFQLRYGEDAEALAYLLAARAVFPGDADVLRLLAHALVKVGRAEEADGVLAELDRVVRPPPPLALLSRALVRLAQGRLAEARRLFAQYREHGHERDEPHDDYGDRAA